MTAYICAEHRPTRLQKVKSYITQHIHPTAMESTPELVLCDACRPRGTPATEYCDPCFTALETEIENYWMPLINKAKKDLAILKKEREKFEATYYKSQYALTEKQLDLELAGRKGEKWRTLGTELLERMDIHADVKKEMHGRRLDLEDELKIQRRSFARELWHLRQSHCGFDEVPPA